MKAGSITDPSKVWMNDPERLRIANVRRRLTRHGSAWTSRMCDARFADRRGGVFASEETFSQLLAFTAAGGLDALADPTLDCCPYCGRAAPTHDRAGP